MSYVSYVGLANSNFFGDGVRKIDYVAVVDKHVLKSNQRDHILTFVKNLTRLGVNVEAKHATIHNNIYLCIHIPNKAIAHFAELHGVNIYNPGHYYIPMSSINLFRGKTGLSNDIDTFKREKGEVTSTEKNLILHEVLSEIKFGPDEDEYGVEKLIRLHAVKAAYPLHDGPYDYDDGINDAFLNDRQLLFKYWANFSLWYKEQPLNIIEKYYGTEVAFYFAWLGFYNKMLLPAAFLGLLCFIISVILLIAVHNERAEDICESDKVMCPMCRSAGCVPKPLSASCIVARIIVLFDNYAAVTFAIFMSFWATAFICLWQRKENVLKIRWNVTDVETDTKVRLQYKEKVKTKRLSLVTGKTEYYTSAKIKAWCYFVSYGTCLFYMLVVILAVFGIILYRVVLSALIRANNHEDNLETVEMMLLLSSAAILQVILIKIFGRFYANLSDRLTVLENPRTQTEFDNAVVWKRYFLGFVNNYASLFYNAFFRGRFYAPMDEPSKTNIETDICHPCGCLMAVCIQLFFLMVLKSFIGNVWTITVPKIVRCWKRQITQSVPQFEEEFSLIPSGQHLLTTEFMEMIIQYGFVTFFVAAFPLAPFFALLINCLELRLDAQKLIMRHRRPVPKKQAGIGPWNDILIIITQLSIATNAFVVAFTSDVVPREIYRHQHGSLEGYIHSTLSIYKMKDHEHGNSSLCYYKGLRYPPEHPLKYKLMPQFWYELGIRLLCVILFEHFIWVLNGIIMYFIPEVPPQVKQKFHHEKNKDRDLKLKILEERSQKSLRRRLSSIFPW